MQTWEQVYNRHPVSPKSPAPRNQYYYNCSLNRHCKARRDSVWRQPSVRRPQIYKPNPQKEEKESENNERQKDERAALQPMASTKL